MTLVGVMVADTSLQMPDFRAAERTYPLPTQMEGRRGGKTAKNEKETGGPGRSKICRRESLGLREGGGWGENGAWSGAQGKMHMKRLVWLVLFGIAAFSSVPLAFAAGDADEAGDGTDEAVVLGEEDFAEQLEILRNQYRRMTPGNGGFVQDAGPWPAAWEEFSPRWNTAPATRDLATWVVPVVAEREGRETVLRNGHGAELWRGTTEFAKDDSVNVALTGTLVDESDWPLYMAAKEELAWRRAAEACRQEPGGLRGTTHGPCTTGLHFVSAVGNFATSPPEMHVGLVWTNNATVDVFAYGPLHTSATYQVQYTNDENQVVTEDLEQWYYADAPLKGFGNDWQWVGSMAVSNTGTNVFVDSQFPTNRGIVRYYAAAEAVDSDGDGLNDGFETFVFHSDPELGDSDGDGIGDGLEVALGADPADAGDCPMIMINAVLYNPDGDDSGWEWVELYSAGARAADLSGFRLEVGRSFGWDGALEFSPGTSIEPGRCLLVGESFVTNADVSATLNIPNRNSSGWPTGVRLVWSGATNGSVVDVVMLGGNTNFNLDTTGWLSAASIEAHSGNAAVRCHTGWDTDRAEDWTWAAGRTGQGAGIDIDTDGDGLSDAVERAGSANANTNAPWFGEPTDPWNADSDGDGLGDYEECVLHGTNPNAWASDGDIWPWAVPGTAVSNWPGSDSFELANGWNPLVADENTNGIPDSWEMAMVPTNIPSAPGAAFWLQGVDSDGDGVDNLAEMGQNSNPTDVNDSTPHDYTSHFESSCPGWTNGLIDNNVGFRGWVKLVFDSVAPGSCIGVKVSDGNVLEEFDLTWSGADELARFAGDTAKTQYISGIVTHNACLKVQDAGLHPHEGATQGGEYAISVYSGKLVPDANRDGTIDETDAGAIAQERPFRFWLNNDNDNGTFSPGANDAPGNADPDCFNGNVDGVCDLEDFTPVWFDLHDFLVDFPGSTCVLKHPGWAVNAVYTDLTKDQAGMFLSPVNSVYGSTFQQAAESAEVFQVTSEGVELSQAFLEKIRQNPSKGVLLLEGCAASAAPLQLEARIGVLKFMEHSLPMNVSSVENMYRWINLRGICGGGVVDPTDTSEPANFPDEESNGKHFVFVHGYSVNETEARAWAAEMFKRLWQCGSKAMFTAVTWRGDHGQLPIIDITPDYYINVLHAFDTAAMFASRLETDLPGELFVGAHSLGNMLVSSAIAEQGLEVSRYFMFNAAVPMEAYDELLVANTLLQPSDWANYHQRLWASYWYDLFQEGDGRHALTWRGRFSSITNAVNFYSPAEDILSNATGVAPVGATGAWVGQEMRKGLTYPEWALGNAEGGWEFGSYHNPVIGFVPGTTIPIHSLMSPAQANILPSETLKSHPFFGEFDETALLGENGSTIAQLSSVWRKLLSDAIPALSNPAGSNPIEAWGESRNLNMYRERTDWNSGNRGGSTSSEHSAIKALPFGLTKPVFECIVENGALNEMD
ncbi:MAG: lamin tail domain-containing protein [Kiritimatiellae bacterium]|nr:lamin tail domain-containing protein [Kiritimatiellia bacterium]